jgi:hypothetical protein
MKNHWLANRTYLTQLVHHGNKNDKYYGQYCIVRTEFTSTNFESRSVFYLEKDTFLWSNKECWYRKEKYDPSLYYFKSKDVAKMIYDTLIPKEEKIKQ